MKYYYWSRIEKPLHIKKTTPKIHSIRTTPSWTGHLSAKHFQRNQSDSLQLKKIKKTLQQVMTKLPFHHLQKLKSLEIINQMHTSRGMANAHKLILHTKSIENQEELISVFIHEMGHITDLGVLRSLNGGKTEFRDGDIPIFAKDESVDFYRISWAGATVQKPESLRSDFVSGYALTNCFEDFAESYLFYRLHGEKFRFLAKNSQKLRKKYDFLRTKVFHRKEFQTQKLLTRDFDPLIWDATKLEFKSHDLIAVQ
jgi:Txe/YoeB family toxin of Txe-Axe toxin-antitoxin module